MLRMDWMMGRRGKTGSREMGWNVLKSPGGVRRARMAALEMELGTRHMNPSFNSFLYCGGFQRGPDFPPKKEEPKLAMADRKPSDYGTGTQRVRQWAVNSVEAKEKH